MCDLSVCLKSGFTFFFFNQGNVLQAPLFVLPVCLFIFLSLSVCVCLSIDLSKLIRPECVGGWRHRFSNFTVQRTILSCGRQSCWGIKVIHRYRHLLLLILLGKGLGTALLLRPATTWFLLVSGRSTVFFWGGNNSLRVSFVSNRETGGCFGMSILCLSAHSRVFLSSAVVNWALILDT